MLSKLFDVRIVFIFLFLLLASYSYFRTASNPLQKTAADISFVISRGENIRDIAVRLKDRKIIKSPTVFFLTIKLLNLEKKIQAGDYLLSPSWDNKTIAQKLTLGTADFWITIPEGLRREEIAKLFPQFPDFLDKTKNLEGFLFPDTYSLPKNVKSSEVVKILTDNFAKKFQSLKITTDLTKKEIATLASLVEREAKFSPDRFIVAAILTKRLRLAIPLQVDATVQYALANNLCLKEKGAKNDCPWWSKDLTFEDLKIASPFNTYQILGLPPHPIANPGLGALQAVADPAKTDYLYYLSDKNGKMHYGKTLEEHNANIDRFLNSPK